MGVYISRCRYLTLKFLQQVTMGYCYTSVLILNFPEVKPRIVIVDCLKMERKHAIHFSAHNCDEIMFRIFHMLSVACSVAL
jgi:hypothetical protein